MDILVLDTIHGGTEIAAAFTARGDRVDAVDVYRGKSLVSIDDALQQSYDLVVAPVHLDPDHPLLTKHPAAVITHHEAVRQLLGNSVPTPMVEITGARGKTTTALALASCMPEKGVVHTSTGTFLLPEQKMLWKRSITPASVLPAAQYAAEHGRWLIAEESLGVTAAGTLAIISSPDTYSFAMGKKHALAAKTAAVQRASRVLVAPGVALEHPGCVHVEDVAEVSDDICTVTIEGRKHSFRSSLLPLRGYRTPLMLAAAAAAMTGGKPERLNNFSALEGRMSVSREGDIVVVDNSNSGTNVIATIEAASYAREIAGSAALTLVIGEEARAVCEGFSPGEVACAVEHVRPDRLILVDPFRTISPAPTAARAFEGRKVETAASWEEGRRKAVGLTSSGAIVLAVKRWR